MNFPTVSIRDTSEYLLSDSDALHFDLLDKSTVVTFYVPTEYGQTGSNINEVKFVKSERRRVRGEFQVRFSALNLALRMNPPLSPENYKNRIDDVRSALHYLAHSIGLSDSPYSPDELTPLVNWETVRLEPHGTAFYNHDEYVQP